MCGIYGEVTFDGSQAETCIAKSLDRLKRRGPDCGGVYAQGRVVLGHRRLSVIDLSAQSAQPMIDPELGLAVVFNGCIYNYQNIRRRLQQKGYRFFSNGDTEVILKAYAEWGSGCVEHFFGMFAFAIWERDSGRLILARDRLGIKPLYYSHTPERLRFASNTQALLAAGDIDTSIDATALHHYMSFHAVVPAPLTILKGVRKLPAATIRTIEPDGRSSDQTFWKLQVHSTAKDFSRPVADWREEILAALTAATERRLVADVPVGVLLSGGLDSSLLVALLADAADLKTFSVGFERVGDAAGDEFLYSDMIAEKFHTDHTRIYVPSTEAVNWLPDMMQAMSEPMMSHDAIGFYLLAKEVSQHVKVVQSGQGADEVFGGYHWYPKLMNSNDIGSDYANVYFDRTHDEMAEALSPELLRDDFSREFIESYFGGCSAKSPIEKTLQLDAEIMMVDDPVKRVDNMTMAWGLEARVPFLDHELVELAARVPAALKVGRGGKYILKEAARGRVPDEVIDRKKGYFPVPALKYISGPVLEFVRDILQSPKARQRGLFRPEYVDRLLANPAGNLTPKGHSKLWQVALLEGWMQANGI
jgi:asparagine synthase (glutamine-hydrolysing)